MKAHTSSGRRAVVSMAAVAIAAAAVLPTAVLAQSPAAGPAPAA